MPENKSVTPQQELWNYASEFESKAGELLLDPRFKGYRAMPNGEAELRGFYDQAQRAARNMRDRAMEIQEGE